MWLFLQNHNMDFNNSYQSSDNKHLLINQQIEIVCWINNKKTDFNRSNFYTYYEDISSLIEKIEQRFVNHVPFSTMLNYSYEVTYINIKYIYDNLKTFQLIINKQELVDTYIEKSLESLKKILSLIIHMF